MKFRSVSLLLAAEVAAMALWFVSSAILAGIRVEFNISEAQGAALSSAVQLGFVAGAVLSAVFGIADRFDPRRVFACAAITAGIVNALLLITHPGSALAILLRGLTGALLAGVYPVGMKIIAGWGVKDRGFLVGCLVGALTLGTAAPHLIAYLGGGDWRLIIIVASVLAVAAGFTVLKIELGPHHAKAGAFDPRALALAWQEPRIRLAYAGYLGHMWELYAMWAWVGIILAASFELQLSAEDALPLATITAFCAIGIGGVVSALAGFAADRIGKANVAIAAMAVSGMAAVATALSFGGPVWLVIALVMVWGIAVVPDSAQFSALVADAAPKHLAGSLMSLQTALGFALTFVTVQMTPVLAAAIGWPTVLAIMALGPAFGIAAMVKLNRLQRTSA